MDRLNRLTDQDIVEAERNAAVYRTEQATQEALEKMETVYRIAWISFGLGIGSTLMAFLALLVAL